MHWPRAELGCEPGVEGGRMREPSAVDSGGGGGEDGWDKDMRRWVVHVASTANDVGSAISDQDRVESPFA
jgi:hypothetical protein